MAGNKFFVSLNSNAGIVFSVFSSNKNEWRIGLSGSLQKESGTYLAFRKLISEKSIDINGNAKSTWLFTTGISSELVFKLDKLSIGLHEQYSFLAGKDYKYIDDPNTNPNTKRYGYLASTCAFIFNNYTGFMQMNTGRRMFNVSLGFNYQLNHRIKSK